jgi:hypothetical protein
MADTSRSATPEEPSAPNTSAAVHPEVIEREAATITATAFSGTHDHILEADRLLVVENVAGIHFEGNQQDFGSLAAHFVTIYSGLKQGPALNAHLFQNATGIQRLPHATEKLSNVAGFKAQFRVTEQPGSYIVSVLLRILH